MSNNQKILDKIRNLLTLAEDASDTEGQTALLMAQKLMLKYKISQQEVDASNPQEIVIKSLSVYKRIYWWEKVLVKIIAKNFRVMFYIQSHRLPHQESVQRKLVLMGFEEDVELAYEVYHLAAQMMKHYASIALKEIDSDTTIAITRKSYYQGFLDGLKDKFDRQRHEFSEDNPIYDLVIQTPSAVKEKFEHEINGRLKFKAPEYNESSQAYSDGYHKGNTVDLMARHIEQNSSEPRRNS